MISSLSVEELVLPGNAACQGCGSTLCLRVVLKALGRRTVLVIPASCASVYQGQYPKTAINVPVFNTAFASAAAMASGIKASLDMKGIDANVVVWAGDGGTYDIGLQSLSGAAERNENIIYICYNNEMYSNTGVQKSGATPYGAWTTTTIAGKKEHRKDIAELMINHGVPYVATASAGYLQDLYEKVKKAKKVEGFRYIEILTPCPPGWKFPPSKTIEIGKLAVRSGMWILYEYEKGEFKLTGVSKAVARGKGRRDVEEYLLSQGRFKHLSKEDVSEIKRYVEEKWKKILRWEYAASTKFYV